MRADIFLVLGGYTHSREKAKQLIQSGLVTVDGRLVKRPAEDIADGTHQVDVCDPSRFVSRGGEKLDAALTAFGLNPAGWRALDIGASTGGFTDCLLQRGAAEVVAVDSGAGQLAPSIASDRRVTSREHCNARYLTPATIGGRVRLIVMDVSFISGTLILPQFPGLLEEVGDAVCLIKPQFEVGRAHIGKGGIVRDPRAHRLAIDRIVECATELGMQVAGMIPSPILGGDGNREFLAWLTIGQSLPTVSAGQLAALVESKTEGDSHAENRAGNKL